MSNGPDNNQMSGAPTTTSSGPDQLPTPDTQAQPTLFQQAMQSAVQPAPTQQPTAPQPDPQQVRQARDKAIEFHPAVTAAHVARKIGEAIEGGPQYKEDIDPATGAVTRTPIPPSTKSILLGSLANILGSVGQVSGNLSARMQGRAPAPIQPLPTQQAQQQRDQMTEEDFNRVQNQRVRQAKILNSNLENMRLSYALRHEEDSALDQTIANHADDLANWNKAGAVESSKIPSSELLSKGFDKSKYLAIPDGYVPVHDKDGNRVISKDGLPVSELTYSVVDGTTQAPLTQDKYDQLVKYGLMTSKEGFKVPEGGTISSAQLALMNTKLGLIQQSQRELDEVHDSVGGTKVDLASEIKKNPKLLSALEQFHNSASDDPVQQLASLRASNNPKAQAAVGPLISLFGQDNLNKWTAKNQTAPDKMDANSAQQIVSDPRTDKNSPAYKTAVSFLAGQRQQKRDVKADELDAQRTMENGDLGTAAKNIVAGNLAQIKDLASFRGDQKARLYNMITDAATAAGKDPKDYSPAKLEAKAKVLNDFADGKAADNIMAFNTFLQHGSEALDATAAMRAQAGSPLINRPLNWIRKNAANDANFSSFQATLVPVRKEYMNFLNNNRAEHEADLKVMDKVLSDDSTPAQIEASLKQLGESADARLRELGRKYSNTMGEEYPNLIAPEGKQALQRMGIQSSLTGPQQNAAPAPKANPQNAGGPPSNRVVPAGAIPGRDASGNIIGYKTADGKVVTF